MNNINLPSNGNDAMGNELIGDWLDNKRVISMYLAVLHVGFNASNPKATPTSVGKLLESADFIYNWIG